MCTCKTAVLGQTANTDPKSTQACLAAIYAAKPTSHELSNDFRLLRVNTGSHFSRF